jgi:hypothetical protein
MLLPFSMAAVAMVTETIVSREKFQVVMLLAKK